MAKKLKLLGAVVASVVVLAPVVPPPLAQSDETVGVIEYVPFGADPKRITPEQDRETLYEDYEFFLGDSLEMNKTDCVLALLWDEVELTLGIDSLVQMIGADADLPGNIFVFALVRGGVEFVVPDRFRDKILVRTAKAKVQLGHGKHAVAVNDAGFVEFQAYDGPVKVAADEQSAEDFGSIGRFFHGVQHQEEIDVVQDAGLDKLPEATALTGLDCPMAVRGLDRDDGEPGDGGPGDGAGDHG